MIVKVGIVSFLIRLSLCAVWLEYPPPIPEEFKCKTGCYVKVINDVVPFGQVVTPKGNCIRISCSQDLIEYASCGVIGNDNPDCYITEPNLKKTYPDCCPTLECEQDSNCHKIIKKKT